MGLSIFPAAAAASSKTMFRTTLTSGTSYTVPAGVTYLNVTLVGGGGGGGGGQDYYQATGGIGAFGLSGQVIASTLSVTAGASITYAIGAGGTAGTKNADGATGGTTTFTGATSALGGNGGINPYNTVIGRAGTNGGTASNAGAGGGWYSSGGLGGTGKIDIEYWV